MIRHEILEENDLLREEFFKSIGNLKKMYKDGRIVLNKNTLERLSLYLNEERILQFAGYENNQKDKNA